MAVVKFRTKKKNKESEQSMAGAQQMPASNYALLWVVVDVATILVDNGKPKQGG